MYYTTNFTIAEETDAANLTITTDHANGFVVFVDGSAVGEVDDHSHSEGTLALSLELGSLAAGTHTLTTLSESLGFNNLIGRWGGSTTAKAKGITGDVLLTMATADGGGAVMNLTDGSGSNSWVMQPGLGGEARGLADPTSAAAFEGWTSDAVAYEGMPCTWFRASFDTPAAFRGAEDATTLFVDATGLGRGHAFVNGYDLGRYWDITRSKSSAPSTPSQTFYHVPTDWLTADGTANQLVVFDALGASDLSSVKLVTSTVSGTDEVALTDTVDAHDMCLTI